jgi:hypothetical protein
MQALTLAIGQAGIQYFAQELVVEELVKSLSGLKPPDRQISVPDFSINGVGGESDYSNVKINLTKGSTSGFQPRYQSITQRKDGQFQLSFSADHFTANYAWDETYHQYGCIMVNGKPYCSGGDHQKSLSYSPGAGSLATTLTLGFTYDQPIQSYDIKVLGSSGKASNMTPNIPGNSVLQYENLGCFSSHVSAATAESVAAIDFNQSLAQILSPLLRSIPASGQLTPDIHYEFAPGDNGITFPSDQGIAIGVTGRVSYKGQYYPGVAPAPLPVPPPPTDTHHVQAYVSDYELNALHWAFFQAGLLNTIVKPADLPDPDVLKVKTYTSAIPAFKLYATSVMWAQVSPKQVPEVAFQEVYEFPNAVMDLLQKQLPSNVYAMLSGLVGDGYASKADLEEELSEAGVPLEYLATIEKAAKLMGMVVTQNLEFTLTIQNGATPQPTLLFDVARKDILENLGLGVKGDVQTLQYGFRRVKAVATFVSTTIPQFDKKNFGDLIWPVAGEPRYDETLMAMGKTGVPLPMMKDFQFHFEQAQVSIQQGFVSVLAQVAFKGTGAQ